MDNIHLMLLNNKHYHVIILQLLEDPLQLKRLQFVIDGHVDDHGQQYEGLLGNDTPV